MFVPIVFSVGIYKQGRNECAMFKKLFKKVF